MDDHRCGVLRFPALELGVHRLPGWPTRRRGERMSLWNCGPAHWWFAWRPVWTDTGWRWMRRLRRQRVYLGASMPGAAEWWEYTDAGA
jgi:hypothetical protein